jgi:hypothetical protein
MRWALVTISFILKALAILAFGGWAIVCAVLTFSGALTTPIPVAAATGNPQADSFILATAAVWVYGVVCVVVLGWPLLALGMYAAAQWIDLHIDLEMNTRALRHVRRRD